MERTAGLYAVIPAKVLYDTELRPNAKLVYGEISAMARAAGYCWAQNAHFAEILGISKKTVGELIAQLAKREHIKVEVIRDEETNEVLERRIWISGAPGMCTPPPENSGDPSPENQGDPSPENSGDRPPKNPAERNTRENNKIENPPISPQGDKPVGKGKRAKKEHYLPETFGKIYAFYPRHTARAAAQKAWDKLRPDEKTMRAICDALRIQRAYWIATETPKDKIPHLSTWLNGARWTDDPEEYIVPDDSGSDRTGRTIIPEGVEEW